MLHGCWRHSPYFRDGSAASLIDLVRVYFRKRVPGLSVSHAADMSEHLKSPCRSKGSRGSVQRQPFHYERSALDPVVSVAK